MAKYSRLSAADRECIRSGVLLGKTQEEIAKGLGRDRSSICRELKRLPKGQYYPLGTGMKVYFADARAPWQRGTNENTNGLIRDFFPKGTDFLQHSAKDVQTVEDLLNIRPRRVLGFKTPAELTNEYLCK